MKHTWKTLILKEFLFCLFQNTHIFRVRQEFHVFDRNAGIKPFILTKFNFRFVEGTKHNKKNAEQNRTRRK